MQRVVVDMLICGRFFFRQCLYDDARYAAGAVASIDMLKMLCCCYIIDAIFRHATLPPPLPLRMLIQRAKRRYVAAIFFILCLHGALLICARYNTARDTLF